MKTWPLLCCSWFVLTPGAWRAQDVRVRLYTNRAPNEISVKAVGRDLRWRTCTACAEKTAQSLTIAGDVHKNGDIFLIEGRYELRPLREPAFSANYPLKVEEENERLLVTVTMSLEEYVGAVLAAETTAACSIPAARCPSIPTPAVQAAPSVQAVEAVAAVAASTATWSLRTSVARLAGQPRSRRAASTSWSP